MEIQKKIYCSVLGDWCDRTNVNDLGKCGGRKTTPLNTMALALPCEHASGFVNSHLMEKAAGGNVVFVGSLSQDVYQGNLIGDKVVYILSISSGAVIENSRPAA